MESNKKFVVMDWAGQEIYLQKSIYFQNKN